jgi:recombination protein RecA
MNPLDKIIGDINKKYKSELVQKGTEMIYVEKIPFSSPRLNYMTYGGVPIGKSTEFFGPENGGKTTSALDVVANAQKLAYKQWKDSVDEFTELHENLVEKNNKTDAKRIKTLAEDIETLHENGPRKVVYVDSENTLDTDWAELQGVDTEELYLVRPQDHTAEQVFQMILDLVASGQIICIVLDSIPALVSQKLYDKTLEDKSYAGISDAATEFSRKISSLISKHKTAYIQINQIRDNLKNPFDIYHVPGGRALRHLHALRLYVSKGKFIDENNEELANKNAIEPAGNIVDVAMIKTKVCKPDRRVGFYSLKYDSGIDVLSDTVEVAIKYNFIVQSGSFYKMMNPETGEILQGAEDKALQFQGKKNLLQFLRDDVEVFEELYEAINEKVMS